MRTSRRNFLAASAALPFALRSFAEAPAPQWIFLGTDKGKGIYRARWNAATGELGRPELAIAADRADFFALHPKLPVLYSVNSVGDGKGAVSSFRIDTATGELTLLNKVSSHGDGPCFVSVALPWVFVANYSGGSIAAHRVDAEGRLIDEPRNSFACKDHGDACGTLGPVHERQDAPHLHCTTVAPNGDIVVCDLADDSILVFTAPKDTLQPPQRYPARKGSGPRHVAFHPNGKWMYCIHEVDCTIDLYGWNGHALALREGSVTSALAPGTPVKGNTACEIVMSDDGRFLYTCTRGADDIAVYRIDAKTGLLTEQQRVTCGGHVPRFIAFDPSRRWLASCNQNAPGNVAIFAHDPATGRLSATPKIFAAETPMFIQWV